VADSLPYGWHDFDQEIVEAIARKDPAHLDKRPDGGMTCPFTACGREWLHWRDGDYTKGTIPHAGPLVVVHISPTYVLVNPLDNFIVGKELIDLLTRPGSGKAETGRFGNEHSEDTLTFNVFRSLQEAQRLHLLTPLLCDCDEAVEPDLYLWSKRVTDDGFEHWPCLEAVRKELEPKHRQQTEPDAVCHISAWGWIFIEAKFGSPVTTSGDEKRKQAWIDRYVPKAPHLFNCDEIREVPPNEFPEQLLRNIVFADRIACDGERAHVVLLAREKELTPVEKWLRRCLAARPEAVFSRLSWETIYGALPAGEQSLARVRAYLESKSYSLRPAFKL
jgi:hypothetical protein